MVELTRIALQTVDRGVSAGANRGVRASLRVQDVLRELWTTGGAQNISQPRRKDLYVGWRAMRFAERSKRQKHVASAHLSPRRALLGALAFAFAFGGCGTPKALRTNDSSKVAIVCDRNALETCEQSILAMVREGRTVLPHVDAYVAARGANDPWFVLWDHVRAAAKTNQPLFLVEGGTPPASGPIPTKATIARVDSLPAPASTTVESLLLALLKGAEVEMVVRMRTSRLRGQMPQPEVTQFFPNDPLAPFMAGLAPIVRDDGALEHLPADIQLATAIRVAVDHASAFRYVDAAREAERIQELVRTRDPNSEPTLRARYLLSLFAGAGISFEVSAGASSPQTNPTLPDASLATPYGDLLRVRAFKDERAAFRVVGERIVAALAENKRAAMRALYAPEDACVEVPFDAFDAPDDLFLAHWIGRRLAPTLANSGQSTTSGFGLTDWLPRYEALVRNVDEARTTWAHAFALTQERGELGGISLAATPTYKRVDALVGAHLAGLLQLVQTHPERVRLMSIVTLAYARGIIGSPMLRDGLVDLLRRAVETRIARASDASALFDASVAGVLAATAYPTAIQAPVYTGLFTAFHDKLNRDFSRQTGWGVAGLFAADTLAGFVAGSPPDLGPAASEISRALADPALPERSIGRLVAASARYLALGANHELDPDAVDASRWPVARRAARDVLREAVAGLSDSAAPLSAGLLDDIAMLGDQTMTVVASFAQEKPASSGPVCASTNAGPSPAVRRALARIGDLRRKILANPSLAKEGPGVSRVRLAVTLLSDAIDIVSRKKKDSPIAFTISDADAERNVAEALSSWNERAIANALGSSYGIARRWLGGFASKGAVGADLDRARKLVSSLAALFRDDATGTSVTLFDALARAASARTHGAADPPVELLLVDYARTLRTLGKPDQADLCLLGAMLVSVISERPIRAEAIAAADDASSDLAWTLRFAREVYRARGGTAPDPTAYANGMRDAVRRSCEDPAVVDEVVRVMDAIRLASTGDRTKARKILEEFLSKVETRGFSLPRMNYRYEEKTVSKVFSTSLEVSLGAGFIEGSSRFQIGLGVRSPGQPEGSLVARLLPPSSERDEEMVRYYVHVGAIAALLHFLDGDPERGAETASRVIDAAFFGVRLGGRAVGGMDPKTTAADARAVLAVVAVLAADAGKPLLAGDLWSLVRATLAPDTDDKAVDDILGHLPIALFAVSSAKPPIERAKRALRVAAEPLACTDEKVELGGYEAPACDEYPFALALRAGGALRKLPHLRRDSSKPCPTSVSALDTFLVGVEKGGYDPDAFTRAVGELVSGGRVYDAAVLLARQRQPTHCNPNLVAAARAVGRSSAVGRSLRADVLSVAVNCSLLDDATLADIALVDIETSQLADRGRNLALLMFAAELGIARARWDVLGRLAKSPTFVSRWLDTNPKAAMFAAVLAQATSVLAKDPGAAQTGVGVVDLFCDKLPQVDAAACDAVGAMRRATDSSDAERIAKDSVAAALQRVSALRTKR